MSSWKGAISQRRTYAISLREAAEAMLPPEVQSAVSRRIDERQRAELPPARWDDRSNAALPAFGVAGVIALTIQATGVPYTFTLLAFNLGVPAAMLWFSKWVLDAKDERLEMQRWEIEAEEWGRAVRAGDHIVKPK